MAIDERVCNVVLLVNNGISKFGIIDSLTFVEQVDKCGNSQGGGTVGVVTDIAKWLLTMLAKREKSGNSHGGCVALYFGTSICMFMVVWSNSLAIPISVCVKGRNMIVLSVLVLLVRVKSVISGNTHFGHLAGRTFHSAKRDNGSGHIEGCG